MRFSCSELNLEVEVDFKVGFTVEVKVEVEVHLGCIICTCYHSLWLLLSEKKMRSSNILCSTIVLLIYKYKYFILYACDVTAHSLSSSLKNFP